LGEKVFSGSQNMYLYCFNSSTGKVLWKYKALGKVDSSPVVCGGSVVFASGEGRLHILETSTGKENWSYEIGCKISSTPAVTSTLVVIGGEDGRVYAFGK
jgi:outer membrane protein assembly factor BamB